MVGYFQFSVPAAWTVAAFSLMSAGRVNAQENSAATQAETFETQSEGVWKNGVGDGFQSTAQSLSFELGVAPGLALLGSRQAHDLALASLSYGHMLCGVLAEDHWFRGNWEIRGELFGGAQYSPTADWIVGLTPHLRYNFATGTRWMPFVDGGAGVTATEIGPPDLSGTFEFNLQANCGLHWLIRDNLALTFETGYMHLSCAGIHKPNQGLNCVKGMLGLSWFF
jgi:lipid A 3-O-deacylase